MKWIRWVPVTLMLLFSISSPCAAQGGDKAALDAIRKVQHLLRSDTNVGRYRMRVVTPEWSREMELDSWDDRPHKSFFIRILAPRKDRNTTFLKVGLNLWMYIPKLERDIRIPPSMMLSSWMGSDFTNDDLVKTSSVVDDYTHRIIGDKDGVLTVESLPKPNAAVVWGKLIHRIGADGLPLSEAFYDEHGKLVRMLRFEKPKELGGRRIPSRWVMESLDKPGHRTIMDLEQITFDAPIPPSIFERANLRRAGMSP